MLGQIFTKDAASRSRADTVDRRTGRDKDLTKAIGYALFETMVRRLKRNMASTEGGAKINCKLTLIPLTWRIG